MNAHLTGRKSRAFFLFLPKQGVFPLEQRNNLVILPPQKRIVNNESLQNKLRF